MHELPELNYEYDALEPYFDEQTMKIHHTKHHQAYVNKLNKALENSDLKDKDVKELIEDLDSVPEEIRDAVRNHGGGHFNHSFFWKLLKKNVELKGDIKDEIEKEFGSYEKFKEEFSNKSVTLFGSGWTWLISNNGKLEIIQTQNQNSPVSKGMKPLLGLDVWEHAYYLKYQNKRPDYVEAFFNLINWDKVNENYRG